MSSAGTIIWPRRDTLSSVNAPSSSQLIIQLSVKEHPRSGVLIVFIAEKRHYHNPKKTWQGVRADGEHAIDSREQSQRVPLAEAQSAAMVTSSGRVVRLIATFHPFKTRTFAVHRMGEYLTAVFTPLLVFLVQISRSSFSIHLIQTKIPFFLLEHRDNFN